MMIYHNLPPASAPARILKAAAEVRWGRCRVSRGWYGEDDEFIYDDDQRRMTIYDETRIYLFIYLGMAAVTNL
jgi:hypothetical protein